MEEPKHGLECVICLSAFEDNDVGRNLPKCGHGFHVDCIDMWLQSHSNCPICRAPLLSTDKVPAANSADSQVISLESAGELLNGEVVVIDGNSRLDNLTALSDSGHRQIAAANDDNLSASSSSLTLSSALGCPLKRMLSRNISESQAFPSSNTTKLEEVWERQKECSLLCNDHKLQHLVDNFAYILGNLLSSFSEFSLG